MLGHKFMVPCKVEELLSHHYGSEDGWKTPMEKRFKFHNANWENGEARSLSELPYMYRHFDNKGDILVNKTLENINEFYFPLTGRTLTNLPNNDEEFI
jgi:hypothetical protein